ncbi:MAG: hypothetical protein AAF223_02055, partial [Bacteroidota bacterium]
MQPPNQPKIFYYIIISILLASVSCQTLLPQDAYYPVNPVADETPVYRNEEGVIIIDLTRLADTLSLPVEVYH